MNELSLPIVIFIEIFCSPHMSVFVLMPLAEMINKSKKTITFCILFTIRVIILVIGNSISPTTTMFIDFISIFIGAFVIIPISTGLRKELGVRTTKFNDFEEVSLSVLENSGISHPEILEGMLKNKYIQFLNSRSNFDYNTLNGVCTEHQYSIISNSLNNLKQKNLKNVIKDIEVSRTRITYFNKDGLQLSLMFLVEASYYDYVIDSSGTIKSGKKDKKKNVLCHVSFIKNIPESNINVTCSQCGAPIDLSQGFACKYCSCLYDNENTDWLIDSFDNF